MTTVSYGGTGPFVNYVSNASLLSGNDVINISATRVDPVSGWAGNDTINGSNVKDQIFGDNGDDVLKGNGGADNIYGGDGNDWIEGGISDFAANNLNGGKRERYNYRR